MKARQRRPRAPKPETLSMDWFTEKTSDDLRGCHSSVQEHEVCLLMCAETLRKFDITNPYQFLNRWTTSEILGGLDAIVGQERQGNEILRPAGWLWNCLVGEAGVLEPVEYPERSSEVVNSIVSQLQRLNCSHPAYLVATYPLEEILETINVVDRMIAKKIEVENVPGFITSLLEGSAGGSVGTEVLMPKGEDFTPAEMTMLVLVARGLSNKEICEKLLISDGARSGHLNSILSKLGAKNRAHAVFIALRRGIIRLEDINGESES